jgi:RND superfamily putative drug exporter
VLLWQDLFGIKHWLVMLMSVIILLAVGSDYNPAGLRFKDEIHEIEDRHHSLHGRYRWRGDVRRSVFAATMAGMMGASHRAGRWVPRSLPAYWWTR